jgi:hypothetical protein
VDTRTKIIPYEDCLIQMRSAPAGTVVTGYFDPLLAAHALRLRECAGHGRPLVVLIADPPEPLLPARARAELVAALEVVDLVAVFKGAGLAAPAGWRVYREEPEDLERRNALVRRVLDRQPAG